MTLLTKIIDILGNFVSIIVILLAGFIIAKFAGKITKRILHETELNAILESAKLPPLSNSIALLVEIIIIIATILFVLQQLGLAIIAIIILAALGGIVILATLLVSIRDAIPNLVAGIYIRSKLKKKIGQNVKIGMTKGKLLRIRAFDSIVDSGDEIHVPHTYTARNI